MILLFGRLIAEQGVEVRLLPYAVQTVPDFEGLDALFSKRVRWMTVMRKMRPWGHFGLLFTWGLPWTSLAVAVHPTLAVAAAYWGGYLACRIFITWMIGVYGLKQEDSVEKDAADPRLGRHGVPCMAHQFYEEVDSLARRRLPTGKWNRPLCCAGHANCCECPPAH